jgi:tetratricopeptide (TPR) repeat protein
MSLFLLQASGSRGYFASMSFSIRSKILFWTLFIALSFYSSVGTQSVNAEDKVETPASPSAFTDSSSNTHWGEWTEARNHYDQKHYSEAMAALQAHPFETANYYYNLGTVSYRLGQLGQAVAYLEKGNRIATHDPDIQYNLSIVRSALSQQMGAEQLDPASTWWEKLADRVTLEQARATLGLMGLIVSLIWIRAYLSTRSLRQTFLNSAGFIGVLCFGITLAVYGIQRLAEGAPPAISLAKDSVRSGPGNQYMELARIEAGTKVRLLGSSVADTVTIQPVGSETPPKVGIANNAEIWKQVRYSSEGVGWVRAASLLTL